MAKMIFSRRISRVAPMLGDKPSETFLSRSILAGSPEIWAIALSKTCSPEIVFSNGILMLKGFWAKAENAQRKMNVKVKSFILVKLEKKIIARGFSGFGRFAGFKGIYKLE